MKRMHRWFVALVAALGLCAQAPGDGVVWDINDYQVEIELGADGAMRIVETIAADFTREAHRGILRNIPYSYTRDGSRFRLRLEVESVTNGAGEARPFSQWRDNGRLHLRIGDPSVWLDGVQTYRIVYAVRRGLLRLGAHDEIYWNAVGDEWPVPIERASCVVRLPDVVNASSARTTSFVGPFGATAPGPPARDIGGNALRFDLPNGLPMRTGLTIVIGVPPGAIPEPALTTRVGWFLADNGVLALPIVLLGALFALWRARGRDLGHAAPIVVQYEPPDGLTPAEAGTLIDERAQTRDITATIIDLAVRGHLIIDATDAPERGEPEPEEVRLQRTGIDGAELLDHERMLLEAVFREGDEVTLDDLRFSFYADLPKVRRAVHESLVDRGYAHSSLAAMRGRWMAAAFIVGVGLVVAAGIAQDAFSLAPVPWLIAAGLCAVELLIFAYYMPRKTVAGRRALEQVQGLEEYIKRAAVEELDAQAKAARFERLLPYAMAFGLSTRWAKAFEGAYLHPPSWYRAPSTSAWSAMWLVHSIDHSTAAMASSMTAMPRSSGGGSSFGGGGSGFSGGFSGGGGGGGGGGAW